MTQQLWESMTEVQQTAHCTAQLREWLAQALPPLSGGGGTVVGGSHIHQIAEDAQS